MREKTYRKRSSPFGFRLTAQGMWSECCQVIFIWNGITILCTKWKWKSRLLYPSWFMCLYNISVVHDNPNENKIWKENISNNSLHPLMPWNQDTPMFTTERCYPIYPSHSSLNKVTLCAELAPQPGISSFPSWPEQQSSVHQRVRVVTAAVIQVLWPESRGLKLEDRPREEIPGNMRTEKLKGCSEFGFTIRGMVDKLNRWSQKSPNENRGRTDQNSV